MIILKDTEEGVLNFNTICQAVRHENYNSIGRLVLYRNCTVKQIKLLKLLFTMKHNPLDFAKQV
jgi:hypothetical protein